MTINRDDPWYPNPSKLDEQCPHGINGGCTECRTALMASGSGVTIRLKLAAEMMKSPTLLIALGISCPPATLPEDMPSADLLIEGALMLTDHMIDRANRDEGSDNGE